MKSDSVKHEIVEARLRNRLTKGEIIQITQLLKRSNREVGECISEVLKMRPQVIQKYVFLGAILSPETQNAVNQLTQLDRDQLLKRTLETISPLLLNIECRLTNNRFILIGDYSLNSVLTELPEGFEKAINQALNNTTTKASNHEC